MNMVKLYDGGVYLVNGTEIVPEAAAPETYQKDTAKQGTIAYSILKAHNTDLKNRLAAYAAQHPAECRQLDADPDTGGMEFTIRKGRLSFRLTAPYSEKRKQAASEAAKRNGFTRKP